MAECDVCKGKQYVIAERADGRLAVERCDTCSTDILDKDAAKLAIRDGIECELNYPCFLKPGFLSRDPGSSQS
jgi:hypothetical protein